MMPNMRTTIMTTFQADLLLSPPPLFFEFMSCGFVVFFFFLVVHLTYLFCVCVCVCSAVGLADGGHHGLAAGPREDSERRIPAEVMYSSSLSSSSSSSSLSSSSSALSSSCNISMYRIVSSSLFDTIYPFTIYKYLPITINTCTQMLIMPTFSIQPMGIV